jgi:hypothetical protein
MLYNLISYTEEPVCDGMYFIQQATRGLAAGSI